MEKRVESLVFRKVTFADFRHINKVGGEEVGGGGQSYIDFPTADIPLDKWGKFLGENTGTGAENRPFWNFTINSLGLDSPITLKIYQRRLQSVSIASQKIHSSKANRVPSWHPENGFPDNFHDLVIYIAKCTDGEYWAGWFLKNEIPRNLIGNSPLLRMFTQDSAGYVRFPRKLFLETTNSSWPFYYSPLIVSNDIPTDEDLNVDLELEDTSPRLQELLDQRRQPEIVERVMRIRQRNGSLVRNLKNLYEGKCQVTGESLTFRKTNGEFYSEVHHLIPLGENGSDSYSNAIVVSPLIHRMLHHANVSEIDLTRIVDGKLPITINGAPYEITWHPLHSVTVETALYN